jgi:hypothetical protein
MHLGNNAAYYAHEYDQCADDGFYGVHGGVFWQYARQHRHQLRNDLRNAVSPVWTAGVPTCTLLAAPTQTANAIKHVATTTANACICGDECIRSLIVVIVPFAILIAK